MKNEHTPSPALRALIGEVTQALKNGTDAAAMAAVERAIAAAVTDKTLLAPAQKEGADDCYRRHILHVDESVPFTLLSLVWRPGQASPIHGHRAWCAVGIAEGALCVETFTGGCVPEKNGAYVCGAGATCVERPGDGDIHRLSNQGGEDAVSIHLYGFNLSEDPARINEIFDESLWQGDGI